MLRNIYRNFIKPLLWLTLFLFVLVVFFYFYFRPAEKVVWGLNFSPDQARYMGFDAKNMFLEVARDLAPKKVRLTAYWENIEPDIGKYIFTETDDLVKIAEEYNIKLTLVLGRKQPRWPECHQPVWYSSLSGHEQTETQLLFVRAVVDRYKNNATIERWQVENEPFFNYGKDCPVMSKEELATEISLVKSLDNTRPVVVTDSGEKGAWMSSYKLADVFGPTMYRKVHNPRYGGYVTYPLPPAWYRIRSGLSSVLFGRKPVVGIELQAEPWFNGHVESISVEDQLKVFSISDFRNNIAYARKSGLAEHYFWGVEWWYRMKEKGHREFWEEAVRTIKN